MSEITKVPVYVLARHAGTRAEDWRPCGKGWTHVNATVGNYATVGNGATVGDDATFARSPLLIQGTRHAAYHVGFGLMGIGCQVKPIAEWRERCEAIGRAHGYGDAEVAEYREYIELIARRDAAIFPATGEAKP